MEKEYTVTITGSDTKDQIARSLKNLIDDILEDPFFIGFEHEDSILIAKIEEE